MSVTFSPDPPGSPPRARFLTQAVERRARDRVQFRMRVLAVAAALFLVACGEQGAPAPSGKEVAAALAGRRCVLEDDVSFGWIRAGLEPLKRGRAAIESGAPEVRPLTDPETRRRLRQAEVVLVADLHDLDLLRDALHRLLRTHVDREDLAAGRIAFGFEAVSPERQEDLRQAVRAHDRDALRAVLAGCWPWPVDAYLDVLLDPALAGLVLFGLGSARDGRHPCSGVSDAERRPGVLLPFPGTSTSESGFGQPARYDLGGDSEWLDVKYGLTFHRKNRLASSVAAEWVRGGNGFRRMFVLYGAAHLLEDAPTGDGIGDLLVRAGVRVVVVVPFLPSWERALYRRFGAAARDRTYEVLPGVLRVPADPRRIVALLPAQPEPPLTRAPPR